MPKEEMTDRNEIYKAEGNERKAEQKRCEKRIRIQKKIIKKANEIKVINRAQDLSVPFITVGTKF